MNVQLLKRSQYRIMPWKNGLGSTAQIDISPEGATFSGDEFLWRVSAATVGASSPFSNFHGCDRLLIVWKGEGLFLNDQFLPPLVPLDFSGDTPIMCRLVRGEVLDLGIIYRRGQVAASMTVQTLAAGKSEKLILGSGSSYLFCAEGSFMVLGNRVEVGDTLRVQGGGEMEVTSTVGAQYFLIHLQETG